MTGTGRWLGLWVLLAALVVLTGCRDEEEATAEPLSAGGDPTNPITVAADGGTAEVGSISSFGTEFYDFPVEAGFNYAVEIVPLAGNPVLYVYDEPDFAFLIGDTVGQLPPLNVIYNTTISDVDLAMVDVAPPDPPDAQFLFFVTSSKPVDPASIDAHFPTPPLTPPGIPINVGGNYSADMVSTDPSHWFEFSIPASGFYTFRLANTVADTNIRVYDNSQVTVLGSCPLVAADWEYCTLFLDATLTQPFLLEVVNFSAVGQAGYQVAVRRLQ